MTMGVIEARLQKLGLELPPVPVPVAEYVPAKRVGDLVYVSGQGPIREGKAAFVGRVGAEVSLEEGYQAARLCVLNCLAVVKAVLGSLDMVQDVVHVRGFVNSAPGFYDQPAVINGASDRLVEIFGEHGKHARAALGTSSLPGNIPVEVELLILARGQERSWREEGENGK